MPRLTETELKTQIDGFHETIKLPKAIPTEPIEDIVSKITSHRQLRALGTIELAEYGVLLSAYAYFLTQQEAALQSTVNWCENHIKLIVGKKVQEVNGYFSEKDVYIRANEPNAAALEEKKALAQAKLDTIKFLSQRLQYLCDTVKLLATEHSRTRRNGG